MAKMRKQSRETGPRTTKKTHPVVRGPVPRKAPQPPLHIKVLSDLVILFLMMSIDIQVLADLAFILQILAILAILLQTRRRNRHTERRSVRP